MRFSLTYALVPQGDNGRPTLRSALLTRVLRTSAVNFVNLCTACVHNDGNAANAATTMEMQQQLDDAYALRTQTYYKRRTGKSYRLVTLMVMI